MTITRNTTDRNYRPVQTVNGAPAPIADAPFLPERYTPPPENHQYFRLQIGDNRIRALSSAIMGNEFWVTGPDGSRLPVRRRTRDRIDPSELGIDPRYGKREPIRMFWTFPAWNYATQSIQIVHLTQSSIHAGFSALIDSEWGSPLNYDVTISKTVSRRGTKEQTEYTVIPSPKRPVDAKIRAEFSATRINLEAIFDGLNPFDDAVIPSRTNGNSPGQIRPSPAGPLRRGPVLAAPIAAIEPFQEGDEDRSASIASENQMPDDGEAFEVWIREALGNGWARAKDTMFAAAAENGINPVQFEDGVGKYVRQLGRAGRENSISFETRKRLFESISSGKFNFDTGRILG